MVFKKGQYGEDLGIEPVESLTEKKKVEPPLRVSGVENDGNGDVNSENDEKGNPPTEETAENSLGPAYKVELSNEKDNEAKPPVYGSDGRMQG